MSDSSNKKTHAQRRREQARDAMRMQLRGWQYVRRLREIANKCETALPTQIPALRLKAEIYRGLLSKVLPDLKAIEHKGTVGYRRVEELSDAELIAELQAERDSEGVAESAGRSSGNPPVH